MRRNSHDPGLTPTSLIACLLGMVAMGMLIQYSDVTVAIPFASEHTLALPAIWVLSALTALGGVFYLLTRWRLLARSELLCVLFCMLISAPLMTQGFWHRIVAILATNPRMEDFEKLDAMNDRLWPHGPNLIAGAFEKANPALTAEGQCRWEDIEYDAGRRASIPILVNETAAQVSRMRIRLPTGDAGRRGAAPGEPYIVSVLVRAPELGPAARYYCRVYADGGGKFTEFFSKADGPKINFLHRTGFRRVGAYGVKFPAGAREFYTLEFGLQGNGRVEWRDPKLFNVTVIESAYKGRMLVTEREYNAAPPDQRAYLVAKPDRMWSLRGLSFILSGYIPVRDWAGPVLVWTLFVLFILTATLAINIIMRRQWLDNERFQLPMARIPSALLDDEGDASGVLPSMWTNRLMHVGFAVALAWMMLKVAHAVNPGVPDVAVRVQLQDYFQNPALARMFQGWRFEVEGIFLPMCVFMELHILLSLVVGYALYRGQFFIGEMTGLTVNPNYPYSEHQCTGAYLGYALILVILSRKYLWSTMRAAVRGPGAGDSDEALSYRWSYLLLLASMAGAVLWARWLGIPAWSMAVFVAFLVTMGVVASRIRSECGTPWGYFLPGNLAMFLGLLGGVWRFGPEAMMLAYIASFMLAPTVFYLIPGAQMELLGLGHRWNVRPKHLFYCAVLGVLGGMLIGGWVFLSNAYALGGDASRYAWSFDTKWWYFFPYNQDLGAANNRMLSPATATAVDHSAWMAFGLAGGVSVVLTLLRQLFSGFWFHPVGFVLGSTDFMNYIWGSALTAWVIRSTVLRFGGASTVRNKLQPFFVGVFLGSCAAYLLLLVYSAYLRSLGQGVPYGFLSS